MPFAAEFILGNLQPAQKEFEYPEQNGPFD